VAIGGSGITVNLVDNYCADRAPLDNPSPHCRLPGHRMTALRRDQAWPYDHI
jgi:hypothetical protein